ncbi:AbrB/MazE/SpoVT family DNA-binding domain-containing protein [Candidatus Woesearchaeota archaeon]|nr:AbrB/MazE/SpoVT family DNA-binding domain-containing protein [Candidatus Woesearchaeota archaeon]
MTEATIKKWGNSLAIVIPKEVVDQQHLKANEKVGLSIFKMADIRHVFGTLPRKMSGQKMKDMAREGWQ